MSSKYYLIRRFFKYLSPISSTLEKGRIDKYSKENIKDQPIFIIGTPLSGSTILYQLITSSFDISYIKNFTNLAKENLLSGYALSHNLYKNKAHNAFESIYGNTKKLGFHAPSEAGYLWYKWFNKDKIYFDKGSISQKSKYEIKTVCFKKFNVLSTLKSYTRYIS